MPRSASPVQDVQVRLVGFAGGVNIRDSLVTLAEDEARLLENGVLDERGKFSKRLGSESKGTFGASGDRILSAHTFYRGENDPQVLIQTSGGKLYYTTNPFAASITWTEITTGLSTTARMAFETFNNKVYMSNGVDNYASWDGTTYATYASAPKGKYLRLWKDTMWVAGVTGLQDRVYSSDPGNAETFGAASWVDIAKGDGDKVAALTSDGTFLIVGKKNRSAIIYDPSTFANRIVDFEKGFESHFGVVRTEGTIFYLSRLGICEWYSDSPSRVISGKIDPLFAPEFLNIGALEGVFAWSFGNRCAWMLPEAGSSTPTLQLEYYPRLAGVTPYGNRGTGPFVFHRMPGAIPWVVRSGANEWLFASHNSANKVLRLFAPIGTDDGVAFVGLIETGALDFGDPVHTKYIRRGRVLGEGVFIIQFRRNFKQAIYKTFPFAQAELAADVWDTSDLWGEGTWGPGDTLLEQDFAPDAYGRFFQIRFTDAASSISTHQVPLGSKNYSILQGAWSVMSVVLEGAVLGVRD